MMRGYKGDVFRAVCVLLMGIPIFLVVLCWSEMHRFQKVLIRGLIFGFALVITSSILGLVHDPWLRPVNSQIAPTNDAANENVAGAVQANLQVSKGNQGAGGGEADNNRNQSSRSFSLDVVVSSLLSVVGVILTMITGYAMAASWRATDEARRAADLAHEAIARTKNAVDAIDLEVKRRMMMYEFELRRTAAYVEMSSRTQDARNDRKRLRREYYYRDEFVKVFERSDLAQIISGLRSFVTNPRIYCELGPEGAMLIEYLLSSVNASEEDRTMLHLILSKQGTQNRDGRAT